MRPTRPRQIRALVIAVETLVMAYSIREAIRPVAAAMSMFADRSAIKVNEKLFGSFERFAAALRTGTREILNLEHKHDRSDQFKNCPPELKT